MSVSVHDVRVEIADEPRWCVPPQLKEILSIGTDGATRTFYLRFFKAILSSISIWFGTVNQAAPSLPSWQPIAGNDPDYPWIAAYDANGQPVVQFTTNAPPPTKQIGTRYLMTAFSDADITTYLNAPGNVRSADQYTLKAVHYDMIPVILANRDAMLVTRSGDVTQDASKWADMQNQMSHRLMTDLAAEPIGTGPTLGIGGYSNTPYLN